MPSIPTLLETSRLLLRQFEERDWDDLHRMFEDEECVRYTIKTPLTHWQTWRMLAGYVGHWSMRGYGPYAVVEKSCGKVMGPVGLWYPGDWPEPEIKWSLSREFWGKGYATEAALFPRTKPRKEWQNVSAASMRKPSRSEMDSPKFTSTRVAMPPSADSDQRAQGGRHPQSGNPELT
jgi:hypothetical protein